MLAEATIRVSLRASHLEPVAVLTAFPEKTAILVRHDPVEVFFTEEDLRRTASRMEGLVTRKKLSVALTERDHVYRSLMAIEACSPILFEHIAAQQPELVKDYADAHMREGIAALLAESMTVRKELGSWGIGAAEVDGFLQGLGETRKTGDGTKLLGLVTRWTGQIATSGTGSAVWDVVQELVRAVGSCSSMVP